MMSEEKETTINPKMASNTDLDGLSNLPDVVLITILSFLNPIEMVQTCVLSKRWHNMWTFVPCLKFKCDDFIQRGNPILRRDLNCTDLERFQNFVSTFLRLRNNCTAVQFFSLQDSESLCNPEIWDLNQMWAGLNNMWIRYALKHNVKKLVLHGQECFNLPDHRIFTCESLQDMYMYLISGKDREFIVPDIIFLPKLKRLHLSRLYVKGNYLDKLIFGCPALESLTLELCDLKMENNISLGSLKKPCIEDCDYLSELVPSTFYISAPCVEYIKFWGHLACGLVIKDMCKVKNAKIHFRDESVHEYYNCEIISSLLGVENLNIEGYYLLKVRICWVPSS